MEEFVDRGGETIVGGEPVRGGEYWAAGQPGGGAPRERDVIFVKMLEGNHDYVGVQEGLQDIIGRKFGLLSPPSFEPESATTVAASDVAASDVDGNSVTEGGGGWSPVVAPSDRGDWTAVVKVAE